MKLDTSSGAEQRADVFRPSEYTCLVLQYLQQHPEIARDRRVCEIGTGNGVIAAQAVLEGASAVTVSDIEEHALQTAKACLASVQRPGCQLRYHQGPMWHPIGDQRFDLILANLPHFPCEHSVQADRLHSWSVGGADGRALMDPFILGLADHLEPGGQAVFAHNSFIGLDGTRAMAEAAGLALSIEHEITVLIPPAKVAALPKRLAAYAPHIYTLGDYVFGQVSLALVCKPHSPKASR